MPKTPKRPRDVNELATHIGKLATHEIEEAPAPNAKAVARGKARAAKLTAAQRKKIARKAAAARWNKR